MLLYMKMYYRIYIQTKLGGNVEDESKFDNDSDILIEHQPADNKDVAQELHSDLSYLKNVAEELCIHNLPPLIRSIGPTPSR